MTVGAAAVEDEDVEDEQEEHEQIEPKLESSRTHDKVLATFRCLVADLCQQYNGGHPGGAMSMAAIGIALYRYVMVYSPLNPAYFNRDRLVISNGHVCLWQYIFMHLTGFPQMTLEQLKSYRSSDPNSLCPGSPQVHHPGIEASTGALGQGVANAVGMAVATKNLAATYNRPGHILINNMTWCTVGDGCLQEGVALEAISLAGHWKLNNLAIIYDNNQITCSGSVDVACSEDINAKMRACGWRVIDVFDGSNNVAGILRALLDAKVETGQPTFVNVRTIIAYGSKREGHASTHGDALGPDDVASIKRRFGMDPGQHFKIGQDVYDFFKASVSVGQAHEARFHRALSIYSYAYPELAQELRARIDGKIPNMDLSKLEIPRDELPHGKYSTRETAAQLVARVAPTWVSLMVATVDLRPAVNMSWEGHVVFQHPDLRAASGLTGNYGGRYMHCGVREHAMASIANGLAAFNPGTMLPITSGFFMFYMYAAAGVRMGVLQGLRVIHLATHDSIAIGTDGPTHQPVALAALFRAMPNILYIRPCDAEETCGAFMVAMDNSRPSTPTIISLSRHPVNQYPNHSDRFGVARGAYVFKEHENADVTLISTGSEMTYAVGAASELGKVGVRTRIVSFPCQRLFEAQSISYRESVMQYARDTPTVVIEAYAVHGWERYADAGYSLRTFGKPLPEDKDTYTYFGFENERIANKVKDLIDRVQRDGIRSLRGNFQDLNGGPMGNDAGSSQG